MNDDESRLEKMFRPQPRNDGTCERCDDLTAYRRLLHLSEELEKLSRRAWSPASTASLQAAAVVARALASKIYQRALREPQ
jgi:hypothetical protein